MTAVLLTALVATVWLAALAFARLPTSTQKLHASSFLGVTAMPLLALAAFAADGASTRAFKLLLLAAITFLIGAAASHAAGRALLYRERFGTRPETLE